ncbi:MAG: N-acetyltransferase [Pirellula sp.]|nr:N-acetyltransferase [Pirellula sp.]
MPSLELRAASAADLPAINDIYNHYVLHSTCTYQTEPETIEARQAWFAAHGEGYPVIVGEQAGEVVGWGSLSKFKDRAAYQPSVEGSVYIRHDRLGHGFGRVLLVDLIARARALGYHTFIGGACASQAASIRLQESLGFERVGQFREVGLKFGRRLDVVYLQLMLQTSTD